MKRVTLILLVTTSLLLQSCSTLIGAGVGSFFNTTHSEVMSSFKTKDAVVSKFGMPTKEEMYKEREIWYYDLGSNINSQALVSGTFGGVRGVENTDVTAKFVEFQFIDDKVVNWRSGRVDYSKNDNTWLGAGIGMIVDLVYFTIAANR